MLTIFDTHTPGPGLGHRIEQADRMTPALSRALVAMSGRLKALEQQGKTERLDRFIADEAWTEMGFELLSLAAPDWTLGRLCRIDGDWLCTLTLHPDVPDWLDDSIEVRHRSRELALLGAVCAALQQNAHGTRSANRAAGPAHRLDVSQYR